MEGQVVHFELPAQDSARAKSFWSSLFGWKFREWDGPVEYSMLDGNEPGGRDLPGAGRREGPGRVLRHRRHRKVDRARAGAGRLGGGQAAHPDDRLVRALYRHRGQRLLALPGRRVRPGSGLARSQAAERARRARAREVRDPRLRWATSSPHVVDPIPAASPVCTARRPRPPHRQARARRVRSREPLRPAR